MVGVVGACGSAALAGSGRVSNAGDTNAVNHEKAVEVAAVDGRLAGPADDGTSGGLDISWPSGALAARA